jgi:hypothetical protein
VRRVSVWLALSLGIVASGCHRAESVAIAPGPEGPHRGLVLKLPENSGFAEIVVEAADGGTARSGRNEVAVYFLGSDVKTPLTPSPTDVRIDLVLGEAQTRKIVSLSERPRSRDPSGKTRFSVPAPDGFDGTLGGKLTANLSGRSIEIAF